MLFEIDFNEPTFQDDNFLEIILGAKIVSTNAEKYPPFEKFEIELNSFEDLEFILQKVDKHFNCVSSAIVSYDPPTIYLDF